MFRPISTRAHGVVDYLAAMMLPVLPRVMGASPRVTKMMDWAAGGTLLYSLLTRYELGAAKVMPMKAHLAMDATQGGVMLAAAALMDDEAPHVRAGLAGVGLFELAMAISTKTESSVDARRREQKALMRDPSVYRVMRQSGGGNVPSAELDANRGHIVPGPVVAGL
jgi:hypothetical protein